MSNSPRRNALARAARSRAAAGSSSTASQRGRDLRRRVSVGEHSVRAVAEHLARAAPRRGDQRRCGGHRLDQGERHRFVVRRESATSAPATSAAASARKPRNVTRLGDTARLGERFEHRAIGAVAGEEEAHVRRRRAARLDRQPLVLDRVQPPDVHQDALARRGAERRARALALRGIGARRAGSRSGSRRSDRAGSPRRRRARRGASARRRPRARCARSRSRFGSRYAALAPNSLLCSVWTIDGDAARTAASRPQYLPMCMCVCTMSGRQSRDRSAPSAAKNARS